MAATQDRYTDTDLLRMLQIIVSDYNRQPTQRDVLSDDRLPTHHTYRNRFGTLAEALRLAGVGNVPKSKSSTHDAIRDILADSGAQITREWVSVGSMIVDFEIEHGGRTFLVDLVDLKNLVPEETYHSIVHIRHSIASVHSDSEYLMVTGAIDAIRHITRIAG